MVRAVPVFSSDGSSGDRVSRTAVSVDLQRNDRVLCTPRGSCNHTLLRKVLRRFFTGSSLLGRVLRSAL